MRWMQKLWELKGDEPSRPLCTPAVWSGEPCTATWWWSTPEPRCHGATESCPCAAQKHITHCRVSCVFTARHYFKTFNVIHKVLVLLCAYVSQCCSSKVFRTVSCGSNVTWQRVRYFNSLWSSLFGKLLLFCLQGEATMKQCHYSQKTVSRHSKDIYRVSESWH